MTDHYAEAERYLELARKFENADDVRFHLMGAAVHATLATVQRSACPHDWIAPKKMGDGEGRTWVRVECALCGAVDDRPDSRTIPWPPRDELVERCVQAILHRPVDRHERPSESAARAVLSVIGGEADRLIADHGFLPVKDHPDDDECTHRADGTDRSYCGEPRDAHEH